MRHQKNRVLGLSYNAFTLNPELVDYCLFGSRFAVGFFDPPGIFGACTQRKEAKIETHRKAGNAATNAHALLYSSVYLAGEKQRGKGSACVG